MTLTNRQASFMAAAVLLPFSLAFAQDAGSDEADVWAAVEAQWNADQAGEGKWIDKMLSDDFSGWGKESPAPRNKASTKMWDRFADKQSKTVAHELYPLAIVVHADVAVAHYLYTSASENKDGEVDVSNGRYSDVLVRTDAGWRFLAWHGGEDD